MGFEPERSQDFEDCFSGYHTACLEKPYHLDHVSKSLCRLLGYTSEELYQRFGHQYSPMICETDRENFLRFLDALAEKEQTLTLQYKMQKKDGTYFSVCDTTTSHRMKDGKMYGFSIVADVSYWPEARPLGDLVSTVLPYGFLQCTCEKYPKITYINKHLSEYLKIDGKNSNSWIKNTWENIYFMLPFEDRDRFESYLDQALKADHPIFIEHYAFCGDGSQIGLTGWMSVVPGTGGKYEFAILYRPTENVITGVEPIQNSSYFPVLKRAYTAIFRLDLESSIVECIHGLNQTPIGSLFGIQMTLESARHVCLNNYILSEDRDMMSAFFRQINDPLDDWGGRTALQVEFRIKGSTQILKLLGVAVRLDGKQVLLCCRNITQLVYSSAQALENETLHKLYDWMDFLSIKKEGTVGMLMLEKDEKGCSLLYGTDSVLHYLGLDSENNSHRSTRPTLEECLKAADITADDWNDLISGKNLYLWSRSAPDAYQFQLSCNPYVNNNKTLYVLWCNKDFLSPTDSSNGDKHIFARTFGHFDLFLDNTPITFSSSKEKELMALLIDRRGGTLTPSQAMSYLWENEPIDDRNSARYRKLAMGLKRTLEKYGIENIIINHNGVRSIDTSAIRCDYYELLAGNTKYKQAFHNAYMSDYSWGEETLATLWDYS
jgi:PAS domain S-box-containing protein